MSRKFDVSVYRYDHSTAGGPAASVMISDDRTCEMVLHQSNLSLDDVSALLNSLSIHGKVLCVHFDGILTIASYTLPSKAALLRVFKDHVLKEVLKL
ncbi:hypothetical protein KC887_04430 [Candidatus Kaiserbacteria bacterium]|nr:hypothetical protein [Candidatus Kaiserbacteria bacterium]